MANSVAESKIVEWLEESYRRQLLVGMFLSVCWAVRFMTCTQLKYLSDEDALLAQCIIFNALVIWMVVGCANLVKSPNKRETSAKAVLTGIVGFALFSSLCICVQASATFKHFLNVFSCERYAFSGTESASNGTVNGRLLDCPWPTMDRASVSGSYLCNFDDRSIDLAAKGHWRRRLGMLCYESTIFAIAVSVVVVLVACVPMIQLLFTTGCRTNGNPTNAVCDANAQIVVDVGNPPPPYSPREVERNLNSAVADQHF